MLQASVFQICLDLMRCINENGTLSDSKSLTLIVCILIGHSCSLWRTARDHRSNARKDSARSVEQILQNDTIL